MAHHQVLIIGGGSAGLAVASILAKRPDAPEIGIIEPSDVHYYQPLWTLVGGGIFPKEESARPEADFIPRGTTWIKDKVTALDPDNNSVTLGSGEKVTYDVLVVAAGIQIDWDKIPGLVEGMSKPGSGVSSNYSYDSVESTFENIKNLKGGVALFTEPSTPIKCGGAPIKIAFLASHYFQKHGLGDKVTKKFMKAGGSIFAVKKYAESLTKVADRYDLKCEWMTELIELRPASKEAVFKRMETGEEIVEKYDMIHVTPPMSSPDFIKKSPLAAETGWVAVDKFTTQHVKYPNVFSLGDCSNLPTSKTGAAIRKQAPVTVKNIQSFLKGKPLAASYDGYTSCPLVTGYDSLILAEFDYDKQPKESFPFDQGKERYSMFALKAYGLPRIYWHGMLQGREF